MKKTPLLLLLLLGAFAATAQQVVLVPEVLASAGTSLTATDARLSFTLGETAITTLTASGISYGQGFHNGVTITTEVDELELTDWHLKVYPTPASQAVFVEFTAPKAGEALNATLWDLQGRQLLKATPLLDFDKNAITVQQLPSGTYLLRLADKAGRAATVKIVKME